MAYLPTRMEANALQGVPSGCIYGSEKVGKQGHIVRCQLGEIRIVHV